MKTGWWHIEWNLTLDGEPVRFDDLSEETQDYIITLIRAGYHAGEIVEEEDNNE